MNLINKIQMGLLRPFSYLRRHPEKIVFYLFTGLMFSLIVSVLFGEAYGAPRIPGTDESGKLEAAGTLLRLLDTALFSWGSRIFAGICVLTAGWNLKEQRFALAVICVLAAIVIGTAPIWVRNIFDMSSGTIFS